MNKASWASVCMALALGACGGGSDNNASPAAATPAAAQDGNATSVQLYENGKAAQGESFTFREVITSPESGSSTRYWTRYYQTVNADHSGLAVDIPADPMNASSRDRFAPDGATLASGSREPLECTYSPATRDVPGTLTVGVSWDNSWSRTCTYYGDTSTDTVRSTGSATALETVTVAAGTFKTIKLEMKRVENRPAGSDLPRWDISQQCWIDVVMGMPVKCALTLVKTLPDPKLPTRTTSTSTELVSYDAPRFASSSKSPARFAGGWNLSMSGTNAGSCASLTIDTEGKLTGNCIDGNGSSHAIDGTVDADGMPKASSPDGATISGTLTPADGSGNWTGSGSSGGAWSMAHR